MCIPYALKMSKLRWFHACLITSTNKYCTSKKHYFYRNFTALLQQVKWTSLPYLNSHTNTFELLEVCPHSLLPAQCLQRKGNDNALDPKVNALQLKSWMKHFTKDPYPMQLGMLLISFLTVKLAEFPVMGKSHKQQSSLLIK